MFRFASPWFLVLLIGLAAMLIFRFWPGKPIQNRGRIRMPSLKGAAPSAGSVGVILARWLPGLKILALFFLVIALARPQWGDQKISETTEGVNIILALDLSESMRALDFKKDNKIIDRLEAVKSVVRDFILKRENDRIGMVVFGSQAFTQLPLTRDTSTIAFMLDHLKIGAAGPSTAIGDAIGISLKRLEDIESKSNIIILLTDGKSNSGELSWQDAARIAAGRNVKIYTIGVGTRGEAPFLVSGVFGKRYVYQKVDVDLGALKAIAEQTRGSFFQASDLETLETIYEMIDRLEKTEVEVEKWVEYKEFYPLALAAGLILFLCHLVLSQTRLMRIP